MADRFPWLPGAIRIVVPISDEGPEDGGADDPGDCAPNAEFPKHQAAIQNAISIALANNVIVSPIIGANPGQEQCVIDFANQLANATGGSAFQSSDPSANLAQTIFDLVVDACSEVLVR